MTLSWLPLAPALCPAAAVVVVLILDAALPHRRRVSAGIAIVALLGGAASALLGTLGEAPADRLSLCLPGPEQLCLWSATPTASMLQVGILASSVAVIALLLDRARGDAVDVTLVLAAATGGACVAAARDLATWLIAVEMATVPIVVLVALRSGARGARGAVTLLVTSLLSFAVLVLGVALWLTATADPVLSAVSARQGLDDPAARPLLVVAVLALIAGLGFKLSLVPFHTWTPTAWSGASLPVTALLASVSKLSASAALLSLVEPLVDVGVAASSVRVIGAVVGALGVISIVVGAVAALRAGDVIRLLAWSTIGQGGWIILPLAAMTPSAQRAAAAYALVYGCAVLVALACVGSLPERTLAGYAGLARSHPTVGLPLLMALLTMAGLPPALLGLVVKVAALRPLLEAGLWPLAVVAVGGVVLGIAVYARWIALLLTPARQPASLPRPRAGARAVAAVGTALLIATSLAPTLLFGRLG